MPRWLTSCAVVALIACHAAAARAQGPGCTEAPQELRGRVRQVREELVTWTCDGRRLQTARKVLRQTDLRRDGKPSRIVVHEHDDEDPKQTVRATCSFDRRGQLTARTARDAKGVVERERYRYDRRGQIVNSSHENVRDQMGERTRYKRDARGRLLEQRTDHGQGNVDSGVRYHYEGGRLLEQTRFVGAQETRIRLVHGAAGRVIRTTASDARSQRVLSVENVRYHPGGERAWRETVDYDERGKLGRRRVETYDAGGRETSTTTTGPDGKLSSRQVTTYDAGGRLSSRTRSGPGGKLQERRTITRDASGNTIEERLTAGGETSKIACQRAYDKRGNWTRLACCAEAWREGDDPLTLPRHAWSCGAPHRPDCRQAARDDRSDEVEVVVLRRKIRYW